MNWRILRNMALAAIIIQAMFVVGWLYDTALRDTRTLDGWMLFSLVIFQMFFSWRRRAPNLPLGRVTYWMQAHIYTGYIVIAAFAFHTRFSLPDTIFEWVLWSLFVLVAMSGLVGTFFMRTIPAKLEETTQQIPFEKIPAMQAELAREVDDLVINAVGETGTAALTGFYTQTLHGFFRKPRNILLHLRQSRRPRNVICDQLKAFDRYLDKKGKETLNSIESRVIAKDNLDYQYAHQGLLTAWLFIHIPATYGMIALAVVHAAVVHAFTAGA